MFKLNPALEHFFVISFITGKTDVYEVLIVVQLLLLHENVHYFLISQLLCICASYNELPYVSALDTTLCAAREVKPMTKLKFFSIGKF